MLITPRTYQQLEAQKRGETVAALDWNVSPGAIAHTKRMLLAHQIGSVQIGEVVRYTLTYTPSLDRILPSPQHLHVKLRNTSAIPLRAAYLVGPYTLYAACYPSTFDPNCKSESTSADGSPDFEPNLKAGGSWTSRLTVPDRVRETAGKANVRRSTDGSTPSVTWVIEISSQVLFSTSATVHFELLIGRDEKSTDLGFAALSSKTVAAPGLLEDHQQSRRNKEKDGKYGAAQPKGVFSHAIRLVVDDTASLWNKPPFPEWKNDASDGEQKEGSVRSGHGSTLSHGKWQRKARPTVEVNGEASNPRKRKRIHLVVLTHGLHSNLGADMLYLKESIDAASEQAREDARKRKRKEWEHKTKRTTDLNRSTEVDSSPSREDGHAPEKAIEEEVLGGSKEDAASSDEDEEEVIVRGFSGNVCRTERGIQYLGKRLAKYVLQMTYPDQDFLPEKQSMKKKLSKVFTGDQLGDVQSGQPQHQHSSIVHPSRRPRERPYKITSISFIAHSLGGLTQAYAIAYIHKHSPQFFDQIKPINFVSMAAPFLGLSNENPLYVKFALDFGLVGRTGQDLGLTWRPPNMVRSGWGAMIGGIGTEGQRARKQPDPGSKPLLRILPTGHTHQVLKKFRNRTVYSNVVNDGIVPLRTSCLLFLDWSGLGRVEKARRGNGLVGTGLSWGWAELTGANASSKAHLHPDSESEAWSQSDVSGDESSGAAKRRGERAEVPQPPEDAVKEENTAQEQSSGEPKPFKPKPDQARRYEDEVYDASTTKESPSPLTGLLTLLRPNQPKKAHHHSPKQSRIYTRSQTTNHSGDIGSPERHISASSATARDPSPVSSRPGIVRGDSLLEEPVESASLPPKTTIFESAGDVLKPPLPSQSFIVDPKSRPRTIFHDRVYHPEDIPPPPTKKQSTTRLSRSISNDRSPSASNSKTTDVFDTSDMKVEEKIARAYHHGLSWRKVLVRLEPDAHNNMVVRRMFANAYGWPVIKHLVDTHFSDTYAANTADTYEPSEERAKPIHEAVGEHGEEVDGATQEMKFKRSASEAHEAQDNVADLKKAASGTTSMNSSFSNKKPSLSREDSAQWDDTLFEVSDSEDEEPDASNRHQRRGPRRLTTSMDSSVDNPGTSEAEIQTFLGKEPDVESPQDLSKGESVLPLAPGISAAGVGLGKRVEEQLHLNEQQNRATAGI